MGKRKRKLLKVQLNVGRKCASCGKRYLNPFSHVCKLRFNQMGQKRIVKKGFGK